MIDIRILTKRMKVFFSQFSAITYKKNETLLRAEDAPQGVYFLVKGHVRMFMLTSEGDELTLNIFKPGNTFPLQWAIGDIPNEYFFETMSDTEILRAPLEDFLNFIKGDREILFDISRSLAHGIDGIDGVFKRLQYLTMGDSYTKVVNVLLLLSRRLGKVKNGDLIIRLPVTHQDIANLSGLTRETVGLEMKKLMKEKLIVKRGRLYLLKNTNMLESKSVINNAVDNSLTPISSK